MDQAVSLYAPDVVRVAPVETGGRPVEVRGMAAIMDNAARMNADIEIHRVDTEGPFVDGNRFAVRFAFDETYRPTGERTTTAKMSLYTVAGGSIVREEVYYYTPPVGGVA
jgi:ketosteroid isomerase-like protein